MFLVVSSLTFTLISNFSLCYVGFTSFSSRPIAKLKKGVGQSKPTAAKQSKLDIVKNTFSKHKRRSHMIAPKLEFSNTQDDPIEIEEVEKEISMQREEIVFTEDGSKKQGSSTAFERGHSSNDLLESEDNHFSTGQGSIRQTPLALLLSIPLVNTLPFLSLLVINF